MPLAATQSEELAFGRRAFRKSCCCFVNIWCWWDHTQVVILILADSISQERAIAKQITCGIPLTDPTASIPNKPPPLLRRHIVGDIPNQPMFLSGNLVRFSDKEQETLCEVNACLANFGTLLLDRMFDLLFGDDTRSPPYRSLRSLKAAIGNTNSTFLFFVDESQGNNMVSNVSRFSESMTELQDNSLVCQSVQCVDLDILPSNPGRTLSPQYCRCSLAKRHIQLMARRRVSENAVMNS